MGDRDEPGVGAAGEGEAGGVLGGIEVARHPLDLGPT
jgi:hypothetical protein